MNLPPLPTMIIGSLPKPAWLTTSRFSVTGEWSLADEALQEAQDDATLLALRAQEAAGIDVVCDGEQRRGSHYSYFLRQLEGIDFEELAPKAMRARTRTNQVPRVVGPIRLKDHLALADYRFLRRHTTRPIKMTLPGPSTLVDGTADQHYGDERALAMDYAAALNEEIRALEAAGCEVVQLDEPVFTRIPWKLADWGVEAMDRAFEGTTVRRSVHVCYGYRARQTQKEWKYGYEEIFPHLERAQVDEYSLEFAEPRLDPGILAGLPTKAVELGVIDVGTDDVETPETVAARLRAALKVLSPDRLIAAPDCGMVMLDRVAAQRKLRALSLGAAIVRQEVEGAAG